MKIEPLPRHKKNPNYHSDRQQVFVVGSKGIPAAYGGFETFVEKLTALRQSDRIRYHVACMGRDGERYLYNDAKCFHIRVPNIGAAKAVYYDVIALRRCIRYCMARPGIEHPIFYVLACRIGPFTRGFARQIHRLGGKLYVNPDGHEWKRAKWSAPIRAYWKWSERLMVQHADLLICDSRGIERYIREEYARYQPRTTFLAYGADGTPSALADDDADYLGWLARHGLRPGGYYLIVGRFIPENNYETMLREFMASHSQRDLVIITNEAPKFRAELEAKLHFSADPRIKFVGTLYEAELLKKVRENAWGYLHGHEVGGTNPSLLEALGSTQVNLLLDVCFNSEVGADAALYWSKDPGSLAALLDRCDALPDSARADLGARAKQRILEAYNWHDITERYEEVFLHGEA